jgi:hypothetical protein
MRSFEMSSFRPVNSSSGVLLGIFFDDLRLIIVQTAETASAHSDGSRDVSIRKHLTISNIVLFFRSATPLCCGVYGCVNWREIP